MLNLQANIIRRIRAGLPSLTPALGLLVLSCSSKAPLNTTMPDSETNPTFTANAPLDTTTSSRKTNLTFSANTPLHPTTSSSKTNLTFTANAPLRATTPGSKTNPAFTANAPLHATISDPQTNFTGTVEIDLNQSPEKYRSRNWILNSTVRIEKMAAGLRCLVQGNTSTNRGIYGGIMLPTPGATGCRLELSFPESDDILAVFVDGYNRDNKRTARWQSGSSKDITPGRG